jgi:hypothetical protein
MNYAFSPLLWQSLCWHWQVSWDMPFASAQAVLQCLVPSAGTQLQAGCAHFADDFMGPPLVDS